MGNWTTEQRQHQQELMQRWRPWKKSTRAKALEGKKIRKEYLQTLKLLNKGIYQRVKLDFSKSKEVYYFLVLLNYLSYCHKV